MLPLSTETRLASVLRERKGREHVGGNPPGPSGAPDVTTLRTAIAGAGMIGRVHLDAVRRTGAPVVGISASTPARAKEAAAALGVPRAYDSSRELVTSDDVDVVHICT